MVHLVVKVEFCGLPYAYFMDVPHGKIHMKSLNTFVRNMARPKGSMGKGVHNGGSNWILDKTYAKISNYGAMNLG